MGEPYNKPLATKEKRRDYSKIIPYLFISPWLFGFFAFTFGPLLLSLVMSFYNWPVIGESTFVGLEDFKTMFTQDPQFWASIKLTFKFAIIFVPLNLVIALL